MYPTNEQEQSERSIIISNLVSNITIPTLKELFSKAGCIEKVRLPLAGSGNNLYASITYDSVESAKLAVILFSQTELFGQQLSVRFARKRRKENFSFLNNMCINGQVQKPIIDLETPCSSSEGSDFENELTDEELSYECPQVYSTKCDCDYHEKKEAAEREFRKAKRTLVQAIREDEQNCWQPLYSRFDPRNFFKRYNWAAWDFGLSNNYEQKGPL